MTALASLTECYTDSEDELLTDKKKSNLKYLNQEVRFKKEVLSSGNSHMKECNNIMQEKVSEAYRWKIENNRNMNKMIQSMKSFRNPSIYEKLISFCEIDETGSNFPSNLHDGHLFGTFSFYDELSKQQSSEMDKASNKVSINEIPKKNCIKNNWAIDKKKSKWDFSSSKAKIKNSSISSLSKPQVISASTIK